MSVYTRSEVSEKTGIGFDAIRYYEKFGLLPMPARSSNGYRQYDEGIIERILFIKQAKICGFTLNEIKRTLFLIDNPEECNTSSDEVIDRKIQEVEAKIHELSRMKEMLQAAREPLRLKNCDEIRLFNFENQRTSEPLK